MSRYRFRPSRSPEERFREKVVMMPDDECWPWRGFLDRDGYGRLRIGNGHVGAHRFAWMLAHGGNSIPTGMFVCHHCDNPSCVRPDHLFIGTAADNNADRDQKGRLPSGERHHNWGKFKPRQLILNLRRPPPHKPGVANGRAKLTEDQIRMILTDSRPGAHIATELGVTSTLVSMVRRRKIWTHIQPRAAQ